MGSCWQSTAAGGSRKEEELAGEDDVDAEKEEELQVQTVAAQLVDLLALKVPSKHVLPEVLAFASPSIASQDSRQRHAAVAVLGIVAEGCAEGLQPSAPEIVPLVVATLRDSCKEVRGAAAFTLGQFAEHMQCAVEFPTMHEMVLPALFAVLPAEQDRSVQERMMYAMNNWLEQLEEEVGPYVKPLLDIVFLTLDNPESRPAVREMLLSATASAAAAAGHAMHAHLPHLLPRLERCQGAVDDASLRPRARALEVLGMLVSANGGREAMAPHIPAAMAATSAGFELEYSELREYGHGIFAEVAEAMGEDFAAYLPGCIEKASASLDLDDGVVYDSDEEAIERDGGDSDSEEDVDSEDGEDGLHLLGCPLANGLRLIGEVFVRLHGVHLGREVTASRGIIRARRPALSQVKDGRELAQVVGYVVANAHGRELLRRRVECAFRLLTRGF